MTVLSDWTRKFLDLLARRGPDSQVSADRPSRGDTVRIHPTAEVSDQAQIGEHTAIWHYAQVREGVRMGRECVVGKNVYVDFDVVIGDRVKIQNNALIYHGATIENGVFIGPAACLTNDRRPRAVTPDGRLKSGDDWEVGPILVQEGAAIGARAVILPDVTVGRWAMVAAGAVVTHDVPAYGLVVGVPAVLQGYVCPCGERLQPVGGEEGNSATMSCPVCGLTFVVDGPALRQATHDDHSASEEGDHAD
ncbi:MAG TPA: acyltransferase [Anaerolineae bacterium]|jgi:UDP-2-acetamido-3-amino-2,3-dideoxy-glucuronate N-acetyltransferase|nr:acyltransferase [Anaerolineae bacterium]